MTRVDEYLDAHPHLDVALHYVWLPMFPRVAENRALSGAVSAFGRPGLTQYWDGARRLGERLHGLAPDVPVAGGGEVLWDAFLVFDADATWDTAGAHLLGGGSTIVEEQGKLFTLLDKLEQAGTAAGD